MPVGDASDLPGWDLAACGLFQESCQYFPRDAQQQSAAGLGVKKEHFLLLAQLVAADIFAKPTQIVKRAAREGESFGIFPRARDQRQAGKVNLRAQTGGVQHLPEVSDKAESGDVGSGAQAKIDCQLGSAAVEGLHPGGDFRQVGISGQTAFESCGRDAKTKRFCQNQAVPGTGAALGEHFVFFHDADHRQTIFGFFVDNAVAAGDDHAGFAGFFGAAANDGAHHFNRQIRWKSGNIERQKRLTAHGVDIRNAVGGGNCPIIVGVVHDWGEKVGRNHQSAFLIQTPDRGVVGRIQAYQEVGIVFGVKSFFDRRQNLSQRFRVEFGSSTRAAGKTGQADLLAIGVFIVHALNHT